MIQGLVSTYRATKDDRYLQAAKELAAKAKTAVLGRETWRVLLHRWQRAAAGADEKRHGLGHSLR